MLLWYYLKEATQRHVILFYHYQTVKSTSLPLHLCYSRKMYRAFKNCIREHWNQSFQKTYEIDHGNHPSPFSYLVFLLILVVSGMQILMYLESKMCRRSDAMLFQLGSPLDQTHCVVFLSSNLPFCQLSFITTCILFVLRMKFWKQLWWNMAKTSGLVLLPYCIGNQQSSAKPDGKWGTPQLGELDS